MGLGCRSHLDVSNSVLEGLGKLAEAMANACLHSLATKSALPCLSGQRCCSPVFRSRWVAGPVSPSLSGMARAGPSRSIGPLPGGSMGSLHESIIDDRVTFRSCWVLHLPHGALGPVFSFALSALKSAIREGQQRKWHPDLTPMKPEPARHGASAPCLGAAWGSLQ